MRRLIKTPKTKSKAKEDQNLIMASIQSTKQTNDELKKDNSFILWEIKINTRKIKSLEKSKLGIQEEIDKLQDLNIKIDKEYNKKRKELLSLDSKLNDSKKSLQEQENTNIVSIKTLESKYNKKAEKLEQEIVLKEQNKTKILTDINVLKQENSVLEKQKSLLHGDINKLNSDLQNIKDTIKKTEENWKELLKKNNKIAETSVKLLTDIEKSEKHLEKCIAKQAIESDKLANINKEIFTQSKRLDEIKQNQVLLVQEQEKMHSLKSKITDLYEKAGININI